MGINQVTEMNKNLQTAVKQADKNGNKKIDNDEITLFFKKGLENNCTSEEILSVTGKLDEGSLEESLFKQIQSIEKDEKEMEELTVQREKRLYEIYQSYCNENDQLEENSKAARKQGIGKMAIIFGAVCGLGSGTLKFLDKRMSTASLSKSILGASKLAVPVGLVIGVLAYLGFNTLESMPNPEPKTQINNQGKRVREIEYQKALQDTEIQEMDSDIQFKNAQIQTKKDVLNSFLTEG